jgi:hypothetical protein
LQIIVVGTPKEYLLPEYFKPGSGTALVSTYDLHHIDFLAPPKPRVKVSHKSGFGVEGLQVKGPDKRR